MTDRELEQKIKKAVEAHTPDVLDNILARCDEAKRLSQEIKQPRVINFKRYIALAASFAVVIGGIVFGRSMLMPPTETPAEIASVVAFDVNPSVEIRLDASEKVVELFANNADAEKIVENVDVNGAELNIAVDAIVYSMISHGYIDDISNSILISIEDEDPTRGAELQAKVAKEVNSVLTSSSINASVLSQYIDEDFDEITTEYQISTGKATLVDEIATKNPELEIEYLTQLSINELNLLSTNPKNTPTDVTASGTPSDGKFIGVEMAIAAALANAGVTENDIIGGIEVEYDMENGVMVYEIEFETKEFDYDYDINAQTSTVENVQTEQNQVEVDDDDDDEDEDIDDELEADDDDDNYVRPTQTTSPNVNPTTNPTFNDDDDDDDDDNDNDLDDLDDDIDDQDELDDIDDDIDEQNDLDDEIDDLDEIDDNIDDIEDDIDDEIDDFEDDLDDEIEDEIEEDDDSDDEDDADDGDDD